MPNSVSRRTFLASATLAALAARSENLWAKDISWLAEVQQRPAHIDNPPMLAPLLKTPAGEAIKTLAEWKTERARLRAAWLEFLGPMPAERPPVKLQILKTEEPRSPELGDLQRQLVRYDSEAGLPVEAWIVRPRGSSLETPAAKAKAGLVALHPTNVATIDEIAGVVGKPERHLAVRLARRGFTVVCPRCFLWQNAKDYTQAVNDFKTRHPQTRGMHKMLWDAQRGLDVLLGLNEVDPARIGALGHSLGAKETLYLAAFDDRIAAAVSSEGGIGFNSTNWDAPWYLGSDFQAQAGSLNHHQLVGLIAPRPFLLLGGETGSGAADGDRSWPYLAAALPVYRLYKDNPNEPVALGLYNHREGHTVSDKSFSRLAEWLETYLTG